jgi:hypothetical protein
MRDEFSPSVKELLAKRVGYQVDGVWIIPRDEP